MTVNVTGEAPAEPGPSDGNQISESQTTTPTEDKTVAQLPSNVTSTTKPTAKTQQFYKGVVIKSWALWLFYALIPLSLTAAVVFFYLRRKRAKNNESVSDDLKNFPSDWPKS